MDDSTVKLLGKISEDLGYLKLGGYLCKESMISVVEDILADVYAVLNRNNGINPDYIKLAQIAYDTVLQTMIDGEKEHGDEWKHKSIDYHKQHALAHAELNYVGDTSEKHTDNGMTRDAMIKYLENR